MTVCSSCHRQLHNPPVIVGGIPFGPKCAKSAKPIPCVDRDLFGFDVPAAAEAARERIRIHIEVLTVDALMAVRDGFRAARQRAGVWS